MNTSDRYEDRYTDPEPGTDPKPMTVGDLRKLLDGVPDHLEVMGEVEFNNGDSYVIGVVRTVEVETRCDDIPALYIWTNANDHTVAKESE